MSKALKLSSQPLKSPAEERNEIETEMTGQQRRFCMAYLANGFDGRAAARIAGYADGPRISCAANNVLNKPAVKHFLRRKMAEMSEKYDISFDWKMGKLKKCVDDTIPDDMPGVAAEMHCGLKAIDIMNKMQGDYAPVNVSQTNFNANIDIDEEKAKELIKQFEKDY